MAKSIKTGIDEICKVKKRFLYVKLQAKGSGFHFLLHGMNSFDTFLKEFIKRVFGVQNLLV